jgi:hypothetical protein
MSFETAYARRVVEYDAMRRRLWIFGQRCHHGAAGTFIASAAALLAPRRTRLPLAVTGGVLMAHDWKDHSIWFQPGRGSQP